MNRREFIFGSAACALMPYTKGNDNHAVALSDVDIARIDDIVRCRKDIVHFTEKYIKVVNIRNGFVNIKLKDWQKKYLRHLASGKEAVLDAHRQSGKTTANIIYAIWKATFYSNQRITFVTCNKLMSESTFDVAQTIVEFLPSWMKARDYANEHYMHNAKRIVLKNQSELIVTYANADFCGYSPGSTLILDELAFFNSKQLENINLLIPINTSYKNSQMIVASTPSTSDNVFSKIVSYFESESSSNLFKVVGV